MPWEHSSPTGQKLNSPRNASATHAPLPTPAAEFGGAGCMSLFDAVDHSPCSTH
jgi:hypothetical protein